MPYVTTVTKNALLWQPSQVYSDHIQNRLSANVESRILIFTEVLPWSLTNPKIMTLFYLAWLVGGVATGASLVQIVAFFNIRFFRTVSNKLNASFTNTYQSVMSLFLIRNTAKCRTHDRLFHYGDCSMLLQMEKSVMRNVKFSSQLCKGSFFTLSVWWNDIHMWGWEMEGKT